MIAVLAARPRHPQATVREIPSPLQGPATAYKSAFSRASVLDCPGYRHLFISGTASIDQNGASIHHGDALAQTDHTLAVLTEILRSQDTHWKDVVRGIAYAKFPHDMSTLDQRVRPFLSTGVPLAVVQADICRPELLVEIELDAWQTRMPITNTAP